MLQEQLRSRGVERRRATRITTSHAALCAIFGLFEGAMGTLAIVVTTMVYHLVWAGVIPAGSTLTLLIAYALLAGCFYGVFSGVSASRFLGNGCSQKGALVDSIVSWTVSSAAALFASFLIGVSGDLSRVSLTFAYLIGVPLLMGIRSIAYSALWARIRAGRLQYEKVGVVGERHEVLRFLANGNLWRAGYQLAGSYYLNADVDMDPGAQEQSIVQIGQGWVNGGVNTVVFVGELDDLITLEWLTNVMRRFAVNVLVTPATFSSHLKFLDVVPLGANNALRYLRKPMGDLGVLLKRAFDLVGALLGLLLLSPLFGVVAILIKLDGPGPVFYLQERRGFNGKTFFIWKFRSMSVTESGWRMQQAVVGDQRITQIGRFIRSTSIDELPQLLNVAIGNMSLVGPRPHAVMHDEELSRQLTSYAQRQRMKPGITGWAQVHGYRGETTTLEQIQGRVQHDLYYIENWSVFLDCWIIVLTLLSRKVRMNVF